MPTVRVLAGIPTILFKSMAAWCLAGLVALMAVAATAWGGPAGPRTGSGPLLTLEEAVSMALRDNRQVKTAALEVAKSERLLSAAQTYRFPNFKLYLMESMQLTPVDFRFPEGSFGYYPAIGPIPSQDTKISSPRRLSTMVYGRLAQPLSQQYKIGLNIKIYELARDISQEKLRSQRQTIINEVKRLYYGLLQTQSGLEAAAEAVKLYRELDRLLDDYVKTQTALKADSLEVKAKLARAEHEALTIRHGLAAQQEQLNNLMGRDLNTEFRVQPAPPATPLENDLESARERALNRRPEIKEALLRTSQAEYDQRLKMAEYIPDLTFTVDYLHMANMSIFPRNIAFAGVMLSWEPFDWGRRWKEAGEKVHTVTQARIQRRETENQVRMEVNHRFRKLKEARDLLRVNQMVREAAREKLRVAMDRFGRQSALLKDVLQTQAGLADANYQYQQALGGFWTARADYEKAIGEE